MEITWAIVSCIIFAVFGYLIGSIPNAVIIGKIHHVDITWKWKPWWNKCLERIWLEMGCRMYDSRLYEGIYSIINCIATNLFYSSI